MKHTVTLATDEGDITTRTAEDLATALGCAIDNHDGRKSQLIADLITSGMIDFDTGPPITPEMMGALENAAMAIDDAWCAYDGDIIRRAEEMRQSPKN